MTPPVAPPPASDPAAEPAEPERGYIGFGPSITGDSLINFALVLDGGVKLSDLPLWARGTAAFGEAVDISGEGAFGRAAIGVEGRACISEGVCGFLDLEAGYQTQHWEPTEYRTERTSEHHHGWVVAGRAGVDLGGEHVRLRIGIELSRYRDTFHDVGTPITWIDGGGVSLALVYRI